MSMVDPNLAVAKMFLAELDAFAGPPSSRLCSECSKAVTVAQLTSNIEAKVICATLAEAIIAVEILKRNAETIGGKWDEKAKTVEFPNGSAVSVEWRHR